MKCWERCTPSIEISTAKKKTTRNNTIEAFALRVQLLDGLHPLVDDIQMTRTPSNQLLQKTRLNSRHPTALLLPFFSSRLARIENRVSGMELLVQLIIDHPSSHRASYRIAMLSLLLREISIITHPAFYR